MQNLEEIVLAIVFMLFLLVPIIAVKMMVRQRKVYAYRTQVLGDMFMATIHDILRGKEDWDWRWDMYNSVSVNVMMRKWWKPLNEFYLDKSFMRVSK